MKETKFQLAIDKYAKGIRYLNEDPDLENESAETVKALQQLRYSLNSNSALVHNKLHAYDDAVQAAQAALNVKDISNAEQAKALYRRAIAHLGLKNEDEALADLKAADKLAPGDGGIVKELNALKKAQADAERKLKASMSKAFA